MIVRLMGDGQYRMDDGHLARLNELDDQASAAIEANDEASLAEHLTALWETVHAEGTRLPDEDLSPSDAIIPPFDLSLAEARQLLNDDGFIPDLPS